MKSTQTSSSAGRGTMVGIIVGAAAGLLTGAVVDRRREAHRS